MAGTVRHARLESRAARRKLKRGRQPHWLAIVPRRAHLGWQRWQDDDAGRWVLRRYVGGKYRTLTIGRADDADAPDGDRVLSFEQAEAKVRAMLGAPAGRVHRLTVRRAMEKYVEHLRSEGKRVDTVLSRGWAHIMPPLGDLVVSELTAEQLQSWLATMAAAPAQNRPTRDGKPQYRSEPVGEDAVRGRRVSANRVLRILKAALNHAYDAGHVSHRDAWGRRLKPFKGVEESRASWLDVAAATRLINAAQPDFRALVRAALETGARYGELAHLKVADFNADAGTLAIRRSKSGKPRHVVLTEEGVAFFSQHCAGRGGGEPMLQRAGGAGWKTSEQARPMHATCGRAGIRPAVSFHALRHTWASLAVMNGVPLLVIAKNLGHRDTRMVEMHYGHLAETYVTEAIRVGAPRYGLVPDASVKRLAPRKRK